MRSQVLRRSRSLLKGSAFHSALRPGRPFRNPQSSLRIPVGIRFSSSVAHDESQGVVQPEPSNSEASPGELERPKRRTKSSTTSSKELDPLPSELDILWTADTVRPDPLDSSVLPPPEIFENVLNNLHIILHPQTQHRAIYTSPAGPPIEPTLALICPIEGGDYVVDATVRELAHRTNSEVVVLDAVQLAAGEWGAFGNAANALQLPRNPLHFLSSSPPSQMADDDNEGDATSQMAVPPQATVTVMAPIPVLMQGRPLVTPPSKRNTAPSKVKIFFDELINIPTKRDPSSEGQETQTPVKSRIIYIRDFPTLAPTSSVWYPPLLSAVRQRRQGPLSRPASPISNPMAIIFGMTPSLTGPVRRSSPSMELGYRNQGSSSKPLWGEDDASNKAREIRLRNLLRKWESSDKSLMDELPDLPTKSDGRSDSARPDIFVIGPGGMPGSPPFLGASVMAHRHDTPISDSNSQFFRTSIVVPSVRSPALERDCRVERRGEINELAMRMGVGAVGGVLEKGRGAIGVRGEEKRVKDDDRGEISMWEDWGKRIEIWSTVRQIADRAVGNVVAARTLSMILEKSTLEPTVIPWTAVHRAWAAQRSSRDVKNAWVKNTSEKSDREQSLDLDTAEASAGDNIDEVIEAIKQDPELDGHEQRLLPLIVKPATMPTSFSQVHLPPHTIDSVRTVVSLPLLHPAAFQKGILKSHGINGVLLFGPPGTGKTLVARALAKEAGCRMLAINPSDVMDMYVGEGEKHVKSIFKLARRLSPCVVFLDEIDALFSARLSAHETGNAAVNRGIITEFMQEMDGLRSSRDTQVIIIGATNRPFDLDDAVLRRLPRRLLLDLPGEKEREEILKIHLHDETLASDVDVKVLARRTESFSGSDIKHLCVAAALDAVKEVVELPWATSTAPSSQPATTPHKPSPSADTKSPTSPSNLDASDPLSPLKSSKMTTDSQNIVRILSLRHFNKALKEIIPSSSESLGSLAALRRWNEEFGEGRADRKRQQVWGKGTFGFIDAKKSVHAQSDR